MPSTPAVAFAGRLLSLLSIALMDFSQKPTGTAEFIPEPGGVNSEDGSCAVPCAGADVARGARDAPSDRTREMPMPKVLVLYCSSYGHIETMAGAIDGRRQPTANEPQGARYQGRRIAEVANKLHG